MTDPRPCDNPACSRAAQVGPLCRACYRYKRRTGVLRPEAVIVRTGERQLIRELEAAARRQRGQWGAA